MKISELGLRATIDNLCGEITWVGDMKERQGKTSTFHTQFIVLKNVEGRTTNPVTDEEIDIQDESIGINLIVHSKEPITKEMKGKTLSLSGLTIHEYEADDGLKRTLNAKMPKRDQTPDHVQKIAEIAKKGTSLPNKTEPTQLDRIEKMLIDLLSEISDKKEIDRGEFPEGEE
jgi:hypothetical protein